ncbi:hypothetical protein LCGC14_0538430 [marine sediment metagenome]|uniref:Uncharacterized protein n=1 Tax=marine sediment metagenome TaxID=412755 RepID=A0A0F9RTS6_9ZZZZ|nr:hypothetical protein [bacterium]
MTRKLLTAVLTDAELKKLRAKPFPERNKIIQDALNKKMRVKVIQLRLEEARRRNQSFIF